MCDQCSGIPERLLNRTHSLSLNGIFVTTLSSINHRKFYDWAYHIILSDCLNHGIFCKPHERIFYKLDCDLVTNNIILGCDQKVILIIITPLELFKTLILHFQNV